MTQDRNDPDLLLTVVQVLILATMPRGEMMEAKKPRHGRVGTGLTEVDSHIDPHNLVHVSAIVSWHSYSSAYRLAD